MIENLREVKSKFKELIETGQKIREREILDHHNVELLNNIEKERKIRHKIMKRILK